MNTIQRLKNQNLLAKILFWTGQIIGTVYIITLLLISGKNIFHFLLFPLGYCDWIDHYLVQEQDWGTDNYRLNSSSRSRIWIRWSQNALCTSDALDFRDLAFVICLSERRQTLRLIKTLEKPGSVKVLELHLDLHEPQPSGWGFFFVTWLSLTYQTKSLNVKMEDV